MGFYREKKKKSLNLLFSIRLPSCLIRSFMEPYFHAEVKQQFSGEQVPGAALKLEAHWTGWESSPRRQGSGWCTEGRNCLLPVSIPDRRKRGLKCKDPGLTSFFSISVKPVSQRGCSIPIAWAPSITGIIHVIASISIYSSKVKCFSTKKAGKVLLYAWIPENTGLKQLLPLLSRSQHRPVNSQLQTCTKLVLPLSRTSWCFSQPRSSTLIFFFFKFWQFPLSLNSSSSFSHSLIISNWFIN